MKIVALVKYVPDAKAERGFLDDGTVDREGTDGLLSELDEYAVEQALQLKDAHDDVEVVALTVGPDDAADAIKRALQMGVDAGVHISDEGLHGSDALATSAVLAAAVRRLTPDLVICGMTSTDGGMGVIPAMLAERLDWPGLTFGAELSLTDRTVTIRRDSDTTSQTVQAELPVVASVTDQSGEARYPSMKGILAAKKKPFDEWSLDDLELDGTAVGLDAALTRVIATTERPPRQAGRIVTDEDGSGAAAVTDFLVAGKYL